MQARSHAATLCIVSDDAVFSVGPATGEHVRVRPLRYRYPEATHYWDANWVDATLAAVERATRDKRLAPDDIVVEGRALETFGPLVRPLLERRARELVAFRARLEARDVALLSDRETLLTRRADRRCRTSARSTRS